MLKILVADDHEVVRKGLMKVLAEGLQPIKVEEARNGQEAVNKVWKSEYDLVVLDIKMPGKNGLDALKEIKQHRPKLPVVILSMHPEEQFAIRTMRAGASGCLTTDCAIAKELCLSVKTISSYRANILLKTRMKNNAEITHYAIQNKLVE